MRFATLATLGCIIGTVCLGAIFPSTGNKHGRGGAVNIVNYASIAAATATPAATPSPTPTATPSPTPIDHVADASARLSLTGISVGKHVIQDDNSTEYVYNGDAEAVQIIGAGTEAANGYYTKRGTVNGRPYYNLIGQGTSGIDHVVYWSTTFWIIQRNGDNGPDYGSADDVAYPWLATTWGEQSGSLPVPTTAHIASKNALTTCAFVSGAGTTAANGIYTERGTYGGKKFYTLLGQPTDAPSEHGFYAIFWDTGSSEWKMFDGGAAQLYNSTDSVAYPWLATWVTGGASSGDSPAPTVVSKTQGELDAGVLVTGAGTPQANDVFPATGINQAKNAYTGIANLSVMDWHDDHGFIWAIGTGAFSSDDTAFPWEATGWSDSATVAENPIASESNWEPLP